MNRRTLLKAALATTAASSTRVLGANDRVRLGIIGCGGRGLYIANFMSQAPGAGFIAFCDVFRPNAEKARAKLNPNAAIHSDLRKLLDTPGLDAVLIATPDHWHATAAVLAIQAGKDVYCEKPLAYSIAEGRAIVRAAAAHPARIVQAGTQQRSAPHIAECARIVQSGQLGRVHFVRVWNYASMFPTGIGRAPDADPPAALDWDMYLGPAPYRPFNPLRFQSTFRWFHDYAGGFITDFGTHRFDSVHQIMGHDQPLTIAASGGRFAQQDMGEMPDTMQVAYQYPGWVLSYECSTLNSHGLGGRTPGIRYYRARGPEDRPHGMAFYGTNGALFVDRISFDLYPEPAEEDKDVNAPPTSFRAERQSVQAKDAASIHAQAFVANVRARTTPNATALTGHRATTIGLLGNISLATGLKLKWDAEREDFSNQPEASALLRREPRKPYDWITI